MAQLYHARPSSLAGIEDPYLAYCLDEAVAHYIGRIKLKHKLRPPKTKDNSELLRKMGVK